MITCRAIVLLGPTGSGKTPLGEALEKQGFHGYHAFHFDFGAHIRAAVNHPADYRYLSAMDIDLLKKKLKENGLLADHEFSVAQRILHSFIETKKCTTYDYIILNGLPRHIGQGVSLNSLITVEEVIHLDCSETVVRHRITENTGGDRTSRTDDSPLEIDRKLAIFREKTAPLLDFYRKSNVTVRSISITDNQRVNDMMEAISSS